MLALTHHRSFAASVIALALASCTAAAPQGSPLDRSAVPPAMQDAFVRLSDGIGKKAALLRNPQPDVLAVMLPSDGIARAERVVTPVLAHLAGRSYSTVVVLAPGGPVPGVVTVGAGRWITSQGPLAIDREAVRMLKESLPFLSTSNAAFEGGTGCDGYIELLRRTLGPFSVVPLLVGPLDGTQQDLLTSALIKLNQDRPREVLTVILSDLSRGLPDGEANIIDIATLGRITALELPELAADLRSGTAVIGNAQAVMAALRMVDSLNAVASVSVRGNSGDADRNRSNVVGYAGILFHNPAGTALVNRDEQHRLLEIARAALKPAVTGGQPRHAAGVKGRLSEPSAVYVTLKRKDTGEMRGSIGIVEPKGPLHEAVAEMAAASAVADRRFEPVGAAEIDNLTVEIAVLGPLKRVGDAGAIVAGRDGVFVVGEGRTGIFLPEVAVEADWDMEKLLTNLCRKAGLPFDAWRVPGTRLFRFTTQRFSD